MSDSTVYLSANVQVEPLCDQWYAWPHLIPPATAARNLTERHLRLMDSYISAPAVHANAVKNPKMLGGPFIDYDGKRVDEVKELHDKTKRRRADLIVLSGALNELNALLMSKATGFSLQSLYCEIPACLRGYVELSYDLNSQPAYRLIEPLLYRSPYYDRHGQSIMLRTITQDDRPFVLSTPRLGDDNSLELSIPFSDDRLDWLFALKRKPAALSEILEKLNVPLGKEQLFRSFVTSETPQPYQSYDGPGIRWRYFGHACILIETRGVSILFDPVLSYTYDSTISRYTYADLPDTIDYVFITHNHQDHILMETLLQIRHKVKTIVVPRNSYGHLQDPSLKLIFEAIGFTNVRELGECEMLQLNENSVAMGVPFFGEHADLEIGTKLAYLLRIDECSLLFAADSCNIEPQMYRHIQEAVGNVDVLFIGMECDGAPLSWLYGALLPRNLERSMDQSRRLSGSNYEQAIDIVETFDAKNVYVYAMGQEPWLNYIMSVKYTAESRPIVESTRLIDECRSRGIYAERLFGEKEILIPTVCTA
ncbi:MAG: metal-dependent hydrolase [Acidobacteriaceae bacterium]|nr:metal-dependent hydrolase [Acidobacteriaceae bacterium]